MHSTTVFKFLYIIVLNLKLIILFCMYVPKKLQSNRKLNAIISVLYNIVQSYNIIVKNSIFILRCYIKYFPIITNNTYIYPRR